MVKVPAKPPYTIGRIELSERIDVDERIGLLEDSVERVDNYVAEESTESSSDGEYKVLEVLSEKEAQKSGLINFLEDIKFEIDSFGHIVEEIGGAVPYPIRRRKGEVFSRMKEKESGIISLSTNIPLPGNFGGYRETEWLAIELATNVYEDVGKIHDGEFYGHKHENPLYEFVHPLNKWATSLRRDHPEELIEDRARKRDFDLEKFGCLISDDLRKKLELKQENESKINGLLSKLESLNPETYTEWLEGFLSEGGKITHYRDRTLDRDFYRANENFELPTLTRMKYFTEEPETHKSGLCGADSVNIVVPEGIEFEGGDLGHCNLYFMEDFTHKGISVPVYENTKPSNL